MELVGCLGLTEILLIGRAAPSCLSVAENTLSVGRQRPLDCTRSRRRCSEVSSAVAVPWHRQGQDSVGLDLSRKVELGQHLDLLATIAEFERLQRPATHR